VWYALEARNQYSPSAFTPVLAINDRPDAIFYDEIAVATSDVAMGVEHAEPSRREANDRPKRSVFPLTCLDGT
jgi:hypothetical protein